MKALLLAAALLVLALSAQPAAAAEPEKVSQAEAIAAADRDPKVREQEREHGEMAPVARMDEGHWEVSYFSDGDQLALVLVDPQSGEVTESWTGYQVAWKMARGYSGAFGHKLNAPYVFLPLCLIFLIGLVDWRRLRRVANLDLLVLLGFGVSHYFFNRAEIGVSVPLVYPVLLYLLGRCLWIGLRGRGEGLRPVWSVTVLVIAALFLMGFRVGLNVADAGAIDVGYAGVVGADRIAHGEPLYDNFPDDIASGDTYGPLNYLTYVPFEAIWPWTGEWDDIPAAHGAAVLFDIATFILLLLVGRRIRPGPEGHRLAATLAFAWAAYPYTAYVLESNSNDSLVAALLVATLLLLGRPLARGATFAAATWSKFVAAPLGPMLLTYRPGLEPQPNQPRPSSAEGVRARPCAQDTLGRPTVLFIIGFLVITVLAITWPAIDPGLKTFYDRTIATQAGRDSPFSIWGQTSLEPLRLTLLVGLGALSLAFAFIPRRKSVVQLAALSAALLILLQLTLHHWFYLYIVWFYPLLLIALASLPARTSQPTPAD
ncbi:MAG TPA: PepSY domain-containing protein [Solirubrobacterales bacterium]